MAKRFSTLQAEAEKKGYSLQQKGDRYYASWEGINLDDDDKDRLVDDMAAVIEVSADDSPYTLREEPNDKGEAVITSDDGEFSDISIAAALAKAKEAKLAKQKPAPAATKRTFSRGAKQPTEAPVREIRGAGQEDKPEMPIQEVEPWEDPAPASPNGPAPTLAQDDKAVLARLCGKMAELLLEAQRLLEMPAQYNAPPANTPKPRISRGK